MLLYTIFFFFQKNVPNSKFVAKFNFSKLFFYFFFIIIAYNDAFPDILFTIGKKKFHMYYNYNPEMSLRMIYAKCVYFIN